MNENTGKIIYDIKAIQEILPHRYPFLLIDRVIEFEDGERIVAIKNVTINEQFFNGHFPKHPVMPGVLVLEAIAQAAAVLAIKSTEGVLPGKTVYLVGAHNVKWKRQIVPGDTMRLELKSIRKRRPMWVMGGEVTIDGKLACSAEISAAEAD